MDIVFETYAYGEQEPVKNFDTTIDEIDGLFIQAENAALTLTERERISDLKYEVLLCIQALKSGHLLANLEDLNIAGEAIGNVFYRRLTSSENKDAVIVVQARSQDGTRWHRFFTSLSRIVEGVLKKNEEDLAAEF
jgi:hypothetical protein